MIDTDLFRVAFSNQGANVRSWQLKNYKGNDGKPLELMNTSAGLNYPFSLYFPGEAGRQSQLGLVHTDRDPDGLGVSYAFSDGHTSVRKILPLPEEQLPGRQVSTEVTVDGKPVPAMIQWRGGFGDLTIPNASANERTLYFDVAKNKLWRTDAAHRQERPGLPPREISPSPAWPINISPRSSCRRATAPPGDDVSDTVRTPLEDKPAAFAGVAVSRWRPATASSSSSAPRISTCSPASTPS